MASGITEAAFTKPPHDDQSRNQQATERQDQMTLKKQANAIDVCSASNIATRKLTAP